MKGLCATCGIPQRQHAVLAPAGCVYLEVDGRKQWSERRRALLSLKMKGRRPDKALAVLNANKAARAAQALEAELKEG